MSTNYLRKIACISYGDVASENPQCRHVVGFEFRCSVCGSYPVMPKKWKSNGQFYGDEWRLGKMKWNRDMFQWKKKWNMKRTPGMAAGAAGSDVLILPRTGRRTSALRVQVPSSHILAEKPSTVIPIAQDPWI